MNIMSLSVVKSSDMCKIPVNVFRGPLDLQGKKLSQIFRIYNPVTIRVACCTRAIHTGRLQCIYSCSLLALNQSELIIRQCLLHGPGFKHLIAAAPAAPVVSLCCSIYYPSSWHRCPNPNSNRKVLEKKKNYVAK